MPIRRFMGSLLLSAGLVFALAGCGGGGSGASAVSTALGTGSWPPPVQLTTNSSCVTQPLTAPAGSTTYNVGPGQAYADLGAMPWLSLKPGDVVNIYYRAQPYATIIAITAVGTPSAPIVINGVTDASCNRPVITGANATIAADALSSGYWTNSPGSYILGAGLMNFTWAQGTQPSPQTLPSYITIQNLTLTGAKTGNTYTNTAGASASWSGSAGIYAVAFSHVTIQNCLIYGNDSGVFFNSQDAPRTSSYVTLRGNIIYGNGMAGSDRAHNIYGQGYRTLYEGNWLGQEAPGAGGSTLKDRSSGTVIRYNYIVATARAIDLVDSEADPTVINDPLYNYAWVYGNIIVDDFSLPDGGSADPIHWGGDSGNSGNYRVGTLYAYFNTILVSNVGSTVSQANPELALFDMPLASETVEARSNVMQFTNDVGYWPMALGFCCGTINLDDTNWITTGTVDQEQSTLNQGTLVVNHNGTVLSGTDPLLSASFLPQPTSPLLGRGVLAPTSVPAADVNLRNLQPTAEYGNRSSTSTNSSGNPSIVPRTSTSTLGALE